ncbi:unnamed protein product [Rotaria sp. Silwood1]|nr:unnamed protein product [Rotaria sp. Silwood1]
MGDKLPADCRFITCDNLKVNTSELTGESIPVSATVQCTSVNFMETKNIEFYSSMVEQGTMASPSDFQRFHNALSTNLKTISDNVTDLEKLAQKLGTPEDSERLRERYHRLQNETKNIMQQTNDALQELNNARVLTEADQRRKKMLTDTLPKQYLATLSRFQQAQHIGARKEKESLDRARAISFHQYGTLDSQLAGDFVSGPTYDQLQRQAVSSIEQEVDMRALRERHEQLRELERNIVEVNELFKDVAKLIHDQGAVIDSIDEHIINTEVKIERGTRHIESSVGHQSAARCKIIILVTILIIVIAIIILVLALTLKK